MESLLPFGFGHGSSSSFVVAGRTMIRVLASLVDIVLVKRWNLLLGIPDKAFYLLGDAIIYQLCCAPLLFPCRFGAACFHQNSCHLLSASAGL